MFCLNFSQMARIVTPYLMELMFLLVIIHQEIHDLHEFPDNALRLFLRALQVWNRGL